MSSPALTGRAPASRWLVLVLVCLAQFMVVLDATITNVALPSIETDLGLSTTDLQWIINGYTLLFGGFLLLGGRAADLFGRKRLFIAGMALFSLASLACALATSAEALIAARAVQGLGAALVSPAALAIIVTTFSGQERTRALGIWARSPPAAPRSACCSAASSPRRCPGSGSSSSTSRSASPRFSRRCAGCPRAASRSAPVASTSWARCSARAASWL